MAEVTIQAVDTSGLAAIFEGELVHPHDPTYEAAMASARRAGVSG